jgi:hypothetical protein
LKKLKLFAKAYSENLKRRNHFGNLNEGRISLKRIINKYDVRM